MTTPLHLSDRPSGHTWLTRPRRTLAPSETPFRRIGSCVSSPLGAPLASFSWAGKS